MSDGFERLVSKMGQAVREQCANSDEEGQLRLISTLLQTVAEMEEESGHSAEEAAIRTGTVSGGNQGGPPDAQPLPGDAAVLRPLSPPIGLVAKHRGRPVSEEQSVAAGVAHNQPQPHYYQNPRACLRGAPNMTGRRAANELASNSQEPKLDCISCHQTLSASRQCVRPCVSAETSTISGEAIMVSNRKRFKHSAPCQDSARWYAAPRQKWRSVPRGEAKAKAAPETGCRVGLYREQGRIWPGTTKNRCWAAGIRP